MKHLTIFAVLFSVIFILQSCSKEGSRPPVMQFSTAEKTFEIKIREGVTISTSVVSGTMIQEAWYINNELTAEGSTFSHIFQTAGVYQINYVATNQFGIQKDSFTVNVAAPIREGGSSEYVTTLFEYVPAPGQFLNKAPGNLVSAEGILGKTGMVCLGAWGGYVVYGFDHSVFNKDGDDIQVLGNALTEWSEPGIVFVMKDDNGNGKPDDTWYELAGSEFGNATTYRRQYEVTYFRPETPDKDVAWKDNLGATGFVKKNTFHKQAYYPEWITAGSYTLKGPWLQTKVDPSRPTYVTSLPYAWGYADNIVGGNLVDINNAVDASGKKINLKAIDFIKIQTAVLGDGGWLGEVSTEVIGIKDLHFKK